MKSSIPIVIDTSLYKQVPKLNSELFLELIKYCRMDRFKLYIPSVVELEYLTWIQKEAQDAFDSVAKASESLTKFYEPPRFFDFMTQFDITINTAKSHIDGVLEKVNSNWQRFKKETNAIVLPIRDHHGGMVMDAYFRGSKPFKNLKNRNDIPDAFIYFSLLDLLQQEEEILFVSSDKHFVNRISDPRILIFENLSGVFLKDEYRIDETFFSSLKDDDRWYHLFQYFKEEIVCKSKKQIDLSDLLWDIGNVFCDDVIGNLTETYSTAKAVQFYHINTRTISSHSYLVPFLADIEVTVSSFASPQELAAVAASRRSSLADKEINEDGKYEIQEVYHSKVNGNLSIRFSETDPLSWKPQVDDTSFFNEKTISEIVVALEDIEICT